MKDVNAGETVGRTGTWTPAKTLAVAAVLRVSDVISEAKAVTLSGGGGGGIGGSIDAHRRQTVEVMTACWYNWWTYRPISWIQSQTNM